MNEAIVVAAAQNKLREVDELVAKLATAESMLEYGYGQLATLLNEVAEFKYWLGTYKSYGEFLEHIQKQYGISKPQLYNYRAAAAALEGSVTVEQMNSMGISKALILRKAKQNTGYLPDSILTKAVDSTVSVKDLRKLLFDVAMLEKPEVGEWFDMEMSAYLTEDEKEVIQGAANAARHGDPAISDALPDWMQRKLIMLKWATEFLGSHSGEVVDGGRGIA